MNQKILEEKTNEIILTEDKINVVIIEDDEDQLSMYKDAIDENNKDKESIYIKAFYLKNDDGLDQILFENRIDTLVIDLNWGSQDINHSGNNVIEKVYMNKRIPIMVISGNLNRLRERRTNTEVYREYTRGEIDFYEVIEEIKKIYLSGYTRIFGHPGKIDQLLNEVFWKYASTNIDTWYRNSKDEVRDKRFMRFITARMNEQLHYVGNNHDKYNSIEFYICPPNSDAFFNGDVVCLNSEYYLVMTPSCDIENKKCDKVTLCKLDFDSFNKLKEKIKEDNISKTTKEKLQKLINNKDQKLHFLPPTIFFNGACVNFENIVEIDVGTFEENNRLKYRISQPFMKDIINRFSLYLRNSEKSELRDMADKFSRQGQPELDIDEIIDIIKKEDSN